MELSGRQEAQKMNLYLSENLRILRQQHGYTLEQLGEIIDVSRQTIAKWEMAETLPDVVHCVRLSTLFQVTLDQFVTMPIQQLNQGESANDDSGRVLGIIGVGEDGQIRLPDSVLQLFEIRTGEKVLLLADKQQGIALVKCSQFE